MSHNAENDVTEEVRAAAREALADAWDLGYYRGVRDAESDQEPADNPFRSSPIPPATTGESA